MSYISRVRKDAALALSNDLRVRPSDVVLFGIPQLSAKFDDGILRRPFHFDVVARLGFIEGRGQAVLLENGSILRILRRGFVSHLIEDAHHKLRILASTLDFLA